MSFKSYVKYLESIGQISPPYNFGIKRDANGNVISNGKEKNINDTVNYYLAKAQSMVTYKNLPETIPERIAKRTLQMNGQALGFRNPDDGNLYLLTGGLGGEPDPNFEPTLYTIANPALNFSGRFKINGWKYCKQQEQFADLDEGVVIRHDSYCMGLLPIFRKYATLLAENELSIWMADINSRILSYLAASDDGTKKSAEKYLQDMTEGNLGVIAQNEFLEGIRTQPNSNSATAGIMQGLIEMEQYLKAACYHEIGLNSNYNMKREAIGAGEAGLNDDALLPFIDDIKKTQQEDWGKFNEMFGTNVEVEFASSWEDNEQETALIHEQMEASGEPLNETHEKQPEKEEQEKEEQTNREEVKNDAANANEER